MNSISNNAVIVGIGATRFSKDSGRTELDMAAEAIIAALDEAGLVPDDIDGIVTHTDDSSDEIAIARTLGIDNLTYFGQCRWDGAGCGMIMRAAIGVAAGMANYVVVCRSVNGASKHLRMGVPGRGYGEQISTGELLQYTFHSPFGLTSQAGSVALLVSRYMHETGATPEQLGWVTMVCREHGAKNPNSLFFEKPLTIKQYLKSPVKIDPLRVIDCYEDMDAAQAFVVTTPERARDLKQTPVTVLAAAQGCVYEKEEKNGFYGASLTDLGEIRHAGQRLFDMSGLKPKAISVVQLDDSYGPLVPMQLEALGFCGRGEGASYVEGGERIRVGGELALNTSGGSLGEGHIFGLNHIAEAIRLTRGTSVAQIENPGPVLVMTGAGGPASGLILGTKQ